MKTIAGDACESVGSSGKKSGLGIRLLDLKA